MEQSSRLLACFISTAGAMALASCAGEATKPSGEEKPTAENASALVDQSVHYLHTIAGPPFTTFNSVAAGCHRPAHLTSGPTPPPAVPANTFTDIIPVLWGNHWSESATNEILRELRGIAYGNTAAWIAKQYRVPPFLATGVVQITPHNTSTTLSAANNDIPNELVQQTADGVLPGSAATILYVVYLPPDVTIQGQCTTGGFCALNSAYSLGTGTYFYAVQPDLTSSACAATCRGPTTNANDATTATASHEVYDLATDQMGGQWEDRSQDPQACGSQIADLCSWQLSQETADSFGTVTLQEAWSNAGNNCEQATPGSPNDTIGDLRGDFGLVSGPGWTTLPVGNYSTGSGNFLLTNGSIDTFPARAATAGAKGLMGDFDGDGRADFALTGAAGWNDIPLAIAIGDGYFNYVSQPVDGFTDGAANPTILQPVTGDFDGDGRSDIALVGGAGWTTIPVAYSNGDGTFTMFNNPDSNTITFESRRQTSPTRPQLLAGDFNGDGRTDLAMVGGSLPDGTPWSLLPIAYSTATRGVFTFDERPNIGLLRDATQHAYAVAGDFDGDGRTDIALTGAPTWNFVDIGFSDGDGTFFLRDGLYDNFPALAKTARVRVVAGDFDGDGSSDIMLFGGAGWASATLLLNPKRDGTYTLHTAMTSTLSSLAAQSQNVQAIGNSYAYQIGGP